MCLIPDGMNLDHLMLAVHGQTTTRRLRAFSTEHKESIPDSPSMQTIRRYLMVIQSRVLVRCLNKANTSSISPKMARYVRLYSLMEANTLFGMMMETIKTLM